MSNKGNILQVFEWETLRVGEGSFTEKHFEALGIWHDRQEKPFFNIGHNKITFSQWVGVIQVGSLVIEVLPKAGDTGEGKQQQADRWKRVLIEMLRKTKKLRLRTSEGTDLSIRRQNLFDLYYKSFVEETETLLHRGLVKKYRRDERNRTAMKGRLNFQKQIARNLVHKERFYTDAFEYDRQNDWNEILLAALRVTSRQAKSGLIRSRSKNLELSFPDWPQRYFCKASFDKLKYDRKTEGYSKAISLAKLILLNFNPQIDSGQEKVLAMFFDMNHLWEDWLLAVYKSTYRGSAVDILGQRSKTFWSSEDADKILKTDILVQKGTETVVLDAKWKRPKGRKPADADIKQMYVYNTMWGSQESWLVYPQIDYNDKVEGAYSLAAETVYNRFDAGTLGMCFVNIFDSNNRLIQRLELPEVAERAMNDL